MDSGSGGGWDLGRRGGLIRPSNDDDDDDDDDLLPVH